MHKKWRCDYLFYSYFDYLCKRKGVTKNKACQEMGVSRSVAAKWKSTQTNPSMATMQKISDYFGISVNDLIAQSTETEKPATISDGQEKNEEELFDIELMHRLTMLSPDELSRVDAFVQGILASR